MFDLLYLRLAKWGRSCEYYTEQREKKNLCWLVQEEGVYSKMVIHLEEGSHKPLVGGSNPPAASFY